MYLFVLYCVIAVMVNKTHYPLGHCLQKYTHILYSKNVSVCLGSDSGAQPVLHRELKCQMSDQMPVLW